MANIENPYFYQGTQTFKNKLGIESQETLRRFEYMATSLNARELVDNPIKGDYGLDHLSKIHYHLFKETYEWAGKPRTLNFSKRDPVDQSWTTDFAKVSNMKTLSDEISQELINKNFLKNLNKKSFVNELSNTYRMLNHLHPFPEGNGRTTQLLIAQLANEAGYKLDFKKIDSDRWNEAAARSLPQRHLYSGETRDANLSYIKNVFEKITDPLEKTRLLNDRASTFINDAPRSAIAKYPELVNAYAMLEAAKLTASRYSTAEQKNRFIDSVKNDIAEKINNNQQLPPVTIKDKILDKDKKPIEK